MKGDLHFEHGRDENSGRSRGQAILSWKRASSISNNGTEFRVIGIRTLNRVRKEMEEKTPLVERGEAARSSTT